MSARDDLPPDAEHPINYRKAFGGSAPPNLAPDAMKTAMSDLMSGVSTCVYALQTDDDLRAVLEGLITDAQAALRSAPVSAPAKGDPIPPADHDEIGRKVLNQPWDIQKAIVTITSHCTALTDECPTGTVADLAGCISQGCLELANALSAPAVGVTRETIARIVCCRNGCILADTERGCGALEPEWGHLETADAILALRPAPDATVSEPASLLHPDATWQVVPKEPTSEMVRAAPGHSRIRETWRAMLAFAPSYSPQHVGREAPVSARDAVIEDRKP